MSERTLDPQHLELAARSAQVARPAVEIVFHSDLRRIGDRCGPLVGALAVGRDAPEFGALPLEDPCVSRHQLTVTWDPRRWLFSVDGATGARRAVQAYDAALTNCRLDAIPPNGYVAVGDRLLLRLDLWVGDRYPSLGLVGASAAMRALRQRIGRVAGLARPTLVQGETGAGKELVARAIHDASPRGQGPFCVLNCANVPAQLFESELFGHRRGAFTGANEDRDGVFQAADGGSLFLDELGELPAELQAKLLRAVQEGKVKRVGDARERAVDVRLIAATHRDLRAEVAAGRFREDLYFRLRALRVEVPPLRERRADVPRLFAHFLERYGDEIGLGWLWRDADVRPPPVPLDFMLDLMRYDWPGNVRELANVVAETAAENQGAGAFVTPDWDGRAAQAPAPQATSQPTSRRPSDGPPDAEALLAVLAEHAFKQEPTAQALGVSRSTLHRWMKALDLPRPRDLAEADIEAERRPGDTLESLAARLRVSPRGLQLRMKALGLSL